MVSCTHCGDPVPAALIDEAGEEQFCCHGCRSAYRLIHDIGAAQFYRLRDSSGISRPEERQKPSPDSPHGSLFDDPTWQAESLRYGNDGSAQVRLSLSGMHCAACIWLLEQLPRLLDGVIATRVSFTHNRIDIRFDPQRVRLGHIVAHIARLGYQAHPWRSDAAESAELRHARSWYLRLAISAAAAMGSMHVTLNILAGEASGDMEQGSFLVFAWVSALLATPVVIYGAWPYHRAAWQALRLGRVTIDSSISLVLLLGYGLSVIELLAGGRAVYFDALAMFTALLLAGRVTLLSATAAARRRAGQMHQLLPPSALRLDAAGKQQRISSEQIQAGDRIRVEAGAMLPCDGELLSPHASLDTAILTGEARPQRVQAGAEVAAGSTVLGQACDLRASGPASASRIGNIIAGLQDVDPSPGPVSQLTERLQRFFAPAVLVIAAGTWLWWYPQDPTMAWQQLLAVLLVCCPCAIGLAAPLTAAFATSRALRRGIFIRDAGVLEALDELRHAVFDKTGTLTEGRMQVIDWAWTETHLSPSERAAIEAACAAAQCHARHPAGLAIRDWLVARGISDAPQPGDDVEEHIGAGIRIRRDGRSIAIGSATWLGLEDDDAIHVCCDERAVATIRIDDPLRPGMAAVLAQLHARGIALHCCSGDSPGRVDACLDELGVPFASRHARCSPETKAALVREWQDSGITAMIGDGINDAAALDAAAIGIGFRGGLEASLACCQVFLSQPSASHLARLLDGAGRSIRGLRACLLVSLAYNLIGVALVFTGIWGPYICAIAMPLSSLTVLAMVVANRAFALETAIEAQCLHSQTPR